MIEYFDSRQSDDLLDYYPEIEPYKTFQLKVSDIHDIYVECSGNPKGKPVVYLHGGPGGGSNTDYRRFFNPEKYHIIQFDQRGCGKSTPFASLEENTTWDLVSDMERIREELSIEKWLVCGGSWGSTLALSYAIKHPSAVSELILRGIFLVRKSEIDWFYQEGCNNIYPEAWNAYRDHIPENERHDFLKAYHKRLNSSDAETRIQAAKVWSFWEGSTSQLIPKTSFADKYAADEFAEAFARIESHYFINGAFLEDDNFILNNIEKIRHIPCKIVQGRYDVVCPSKTAFELKDKFPEADMTLVLDAGHTVSEPGIKHKIIEWANEFSQ